MLSLTRTCIYLYVYMYYFCSSICNESPETSDHGLKDSTVQHCTSQTLSANDDTAVKVVQPCTSQTPSTNDDDTPVKFKLSYSDTSDDETPEAYHTKLRSYIGKVTPV